MSESSPAVVICPIRYDGGPRLDDQALWVELRRVFANTPIQLLGFVSISRESHWIDEFNPLPATSGGSVRDGETARGELVDEAWGSPSRTDRHGRARPGRDARRCPRA